MHFIRGLITFMKMYRCIVCKSFVLTSMGSNPARSYPTSLQNGGGTQVPAQVWNNVRRGSWDLSPTVKAGRTFLVAERCLDNNCMPFENGHINLKLHFLYFCQDIYAHIYYVSELSNQKFYGTSISHKHCFY